MGWFGPSGACGCCGDPCAICSCDTFPTFQLTFAGFLASCCNSLNTSYQYDCDVDGTTPTDSPVNHPGETDWYLADSVTVNCGGDDSIAKIWIKVDFDGCTATIRTVHEQGSVYRELSVTIDCADPDAAPTYATVAASGGDAICSYLYPFAGGFRVSFAWV